MNQLPNRVFTGRIRLTAKPHYHMHHIVFLDSKTIGKVDNMKLLAKLGEFEVFESTTAEQVVDRCLGKEIVIVNTTDNENVIEQVDEQEVSEVVAEDVAPLILETQQT